MTFFENQVKAKRNTYVLIFVFLLAVAAIILVIYGSIAVLLANSRQELELFSRGFGGRSSRQAALWNPDLFIAVTGIVLTFIVSGSLFKILQLRSGGEAVARMLGGQLIPPDTSDPTHRKVLNVVEELAIAAGMHVPPIYLLPSELSINAFAAGFSPNQAVIGVSQGCLTNLSRDELQGVIAHEFSHIINGDMALNIRLIGILHGILVIALTGYYLIRFSGPTRRGSGRKDDSSQLAIIVLGAVLMVVGYIGVFCAKIIKMSVSRQREYLADASAVQFTRNPSGIAGALKKIGGFVYGSKLVHPKAEVASHMYFANGVRAAFSSLLSTHPPLTERIMRIEPSFDGTFPEFTPEQLASTEVTPGAEASQQLSNRTTPEPGRISVEPSKILAQVGSLDGSSLLYAGQLLEALPLKLREASHIPESAKLMIFALLLDQHAPSVRNHQLTTLEQRIGAASMKLLLDFEKTLLELGSRYRLPILDLALPALRSLGANAYESFKTNALELIHADGNLSLFEFLLSTIVYRHLDPHFLGSPKHARPRRKLEDMIDPTSRLLLSLAVMGNTTDPIRAQAAYNAGAESCGIHPSLRKNVKELTEPSIPFLQTALEQLWGADPQITERILAACIACVCVDQTISIEEAELIRAIATSFECPLPPFYAN